MTLTTFLWKAEPSIFPALSWSSTQVNVETRSASPRAVVDVNPADSYVLNRLRCSLILDRIPADAMLDNVALKDLLGRKW